MTKRPGRTFTDEFKLQMISLLKSGKLRADIIREYGLTATAFDRGSMICTPFTGFVQ